MLNPPMPNQMKESRMHWVLWVVPTLLLPCAVTFGGDTYECTVSPVPAVVTGTLSPLSLTLDGKTIVQDSKSYLGIEVNGEPLKPENNTRHTFYSSTNADSVNVALTAPDGSRTNLSQLEFPRVLSARIEGHEVVMVTAGKLVTALVDGKKVALQGAEMRWPLPALPAEITSPHTLVAEIRWPLPALPAEITSPHTLIMVGQNTQPDRLYNLVLAPPPAKKDSGNARLQLLDFEAGFMTAQESVGGASAFELRWRPGYFITDRFAIRANIAGASLKKADSGSFALLDLEAFLRYMPFSSLGLEGGAGVQDWVSFGGVHFASSVTLVVKLPFAPRWLESVTWVTANYGDHTPPIFIESGLGFPSKVLNQ